MESLFQVLNDYLLDIANYLKTNCERLHDSEIDKLSRKVVIRNKDFSVNIYLDEFTCIVDVINHKENFFYKCFYMDDPTSVLNKIIKDLSIR